MGFMKSTKVVKYIFLLVLLTISIGGIYYLQLPNRHKAIIKTRVAHSLHLVDKSWNIATSDSSTSYTTPTLIIDNIYKSMEGPKVMQGFQLDGLKQELVWITSFKTTVVNEYETNNLSNDYICHTNIDYYDSSYYSNWDLPNKIGAHYPRLATLTNGMESYKFPEGFGFPILTNDYLYLSTQSLNQNKKDTIFKEKHRVEIGYKKHQKGIKPLESRTIFIMLPYNLDDPFNENAARANPNLCIPIETKNHSYTNDKGQALSGHWVIFPGKETFRYTITKQLALKDSTSLHHIATHLHPFAESLTLQNSTTGEIIFTAFTENYTNKIGLKNIPEFSSKEGVMLYADNEYELILKTNNTTNEAQDMMASMFLGLYDAELAKKIEEKYLIQ